MRENCVARYRSARLPAPFDHLMQFPGVVGDDGIGEQRERAADHDFLILPPAAIMTDGASVNDAFELVDGFTADQYSVDLATKVRLSGIITEVNGISELPKLRTGSM